MFYHIKKVKKDGMKLVGYLDCLQIHWVNDSDLYGIYDDFAAENFIRDKQGDDFYLFKVVASLHGKKIKCKVCFLGDFTGTNSDMDDNIHEGFTIGKGKVLYWMLTWHGSGHVTVYPRDNPSYGRWISGDTEITLHFK